MTSSSEGFVTSKWRLREGRLSLVRIYQIFTNQGPKDTTPNFHLLSARLLALAKSEPRSAGFSIPTRIRNPEQQKQQQAGDSEPSE
ncbi:hypothetical protein EYF80_045759 [Liparis tanakae]|uniref:Uncharacterized protein n=1 Tax=Liparis tanakae TaxID=230148 RepID=A0A4Z2FSX9_9TELE|nr:hypothetical protein EYF80_045759 [Liparis tanakae]